MRGKGGDGRVGLKRNETTHGRKIKSPDPEAFIKEVGVENLFGPTSS